METSTSTSLTARSINKYSLIAAGAGLIPIPVIDLAAVSGVQFDMIRQLCIQYGVGFDPRRGKAWITSLTGTAFAHVGAVLVKLIPGIGSLVGGMSLSVSAGASTYALGRIVAQHLSNGGDMENLSIEQHRDAFKSYEEEGINVIIEMREEQTRANEKIEELEKMHARGLITDSEFNSVKARVLAAV
ncbi:MAG: DUF697 domain-containing protein [Bacteroidota bacterium]